MIITLCRNPVLYWLWGCCTYAEPDPGEHMDSCLQHQRRLQEQIRPLLGCWGSWESTAAQVRHFPLFTIVRSVTHSINRKFPSSQWNWESSPSLSGVSPVKAHVSHQPYPALLWPSCPLTCLIARPPQRKAKWRYGLKSVSCSDVRFLPIAYLSTLLMYVCLFIYLYILNCWSI